MPNPSPSVNAVATISISTVDLATQVQAVLTNRAGLNIIFAANTVIYQGYYQSTSSGSGLISGTAAVVYVRHAGTSDRLLLNFTPNGGAAVSLQLPVGGVFLHFATSISDPTHVGITALTIINASGSNNPQLAEVFIAL